MSQRSSFNPETKSKSSILSILTMSGPYGLYMYALETCVPWRHVYALETWYMLYGHKRCLLVGEEYMSSCRRRIYGYGRCLLVGEEYIFILILILILILVLVFIIVLVFALVLIFLVLVLFLCCWCCLFLFKCALRLAAGAFFWLKNDILWKSDIS